MNDVSKKSAPITASKQLARFESRSRPLRGFFPFAEAEERAQTRGLGKQAELLFAYERGPQARQLPFGFLRVSPIQEVGGNGANDGVAEKFEPFVAVEIGEAVLVGVRAVREGLHKQRRIRFGETESLPELPKVMLSAVSRHGAVHSCLYER